MNSKDQNPPETSPYASALERVRSIRNDRPSSANPVRSGLVLNLRNRIRAAAIRLRLPVLADIPSMAAPAPKSQLLDKLLPCLWICVVLALVSGLIRTIQVSVAPDSSSVHVNRPAVQTITFTVPWAEKVLNTEMAVTHAWKAISEAGYHTGHCQLLAQVPVSNTSSAGPESFHRIDDASGYCLFQDSWFPNQPIKVTLTQKGNIISAKVVGHTN